MAKATLQQRTHVAIDIGTSKTKIHIDKIGMVFNESTILALDWKSNKVLAIGDAAKKFVGKLSGTLQLKYPMKRGVITDMAMLKKFLLTILSKHSSELKDSIVTLACPTSVTELERSSLIKSIKDLGVFYVNAEDDVKLALYGAGIDVYKTVGNLCLDLGAGKSTAGIVVNGETIQSKWTKIAGNTIDQEIIKQIKSKEQMLVGEITAEQIKNTVSSLVKNKTPLKLTAYGYDLTSGMPKDFEINENDVSKLLLAAFGSITSLVTSVLEGSPNEIAGDVVRNGIIVTGGVGKIPGIKPFLEDFFEIPVKIANNCLTATIEGAIKHKELTIKKYEYENNHIDSLFQ
ncbi:rod shape-determining protein MreB [Spiroplasma gladiatoris]|uniref:Rod shape-determining protein MreB n=1 Tax=Spiroplasma gladiatoris TaxID=2143 RepID=A0A4P7AIC0_9MOLU|nr:rod shape-determining protein [Spiroplasma gladiatoris]QBQ08214.1 rod shape-determining protein MreB [Spiroplasma gladiatoris]